MGDSPFELRVFGVEVRAKLRRAAQVRARREDAERTRTAGQAERVDRVRRLAGLGDDAEHVLGRELEHGQPVEDHPVGDAHALVAAPGDAPRTVAALVAANPDGVDQPSLEARMRLEVAAQLAFDGSALRIAGTESGRFAEEASSLLDALEQGLAGGDGGHNERDSRGHRVLDVLDGAGPLHLAERRVDRDELVSGNDKREQNRHRLAVLAARDVESHEGAARNHVATLGWDDDMAMEAAP